MGQLRFLIRFCLLVVFAVGKASGCQCGESPSAKDAWRDSPAVFLGNVENVSPEELQDGDSVQKVMVRVEAGFKGARTDQRFAISNSLGSCSHTYKRGERILFYLQPSQEPGEWVARGCHRTRIADSSADDLLFLRRLPASAEGNRLSGEVELMEISPEGFPRQRGVPGVLVSISRTGRRPSRCSLMLMASTKSTT